MGAFGSVADLLNQYNHYLGTPDYLDAGHHAPPERHTRIGAAFCATVPAEERARRRARRAGHAQLAPEVPAAAQQARAAQHRGGQRRRAVASDAARSRGPSALARLPVPQSFQLANGLTVIVCPAGRPACCLGSLVVRTGTDANPTDRPGLASFTTP